VFLDGDAGLGEHPEGDEFVEFCVDGGADGIVIDALGHLGVAGGAADLGEAVDDLLGDAADHLSLLRLRERLPQVVETVQRGAALGHRASGVALALDEDGAGAVACGGQGRDDAGRAGPRDDDVALAGGESLRRLLPGTGGRVGGVRAAGEGRLEARAAHPAHAQRDDALGELAAVHEGLLGMRTVGFSARSWLSF